MNKKFFEYWQGVRSKGKLRFILQEGLGWAIFMMIFMGLSNYFSDRDNPKIWNQMLFQSAMWVPFGLLYSTFLWWYNNRKFKKYKEKGGV